MVAGAAAAAAGFPLVDPTADLRLGSDEINLTRDLIAQFRGPSGQVEELETGAILNIGATEILASFTIIPAVAAGAVIQVYGEIELYFPSGYNFAGNLQLRRGATVLHTRRWDAHTRVNRSGHPAIMAAYVVPSGGLPAGTTFDFVATSDVLSAGGVEIWMAYVSWAVR